MFKLVDGKHNFVKNKCKDIAYTFSYATENDKVILEMESTAVR
jgi:hypothetical protein